MTTWFGLLPPDPDTFYTETETETPPGIPTYADLIDLIDGDSLPPDAVFSSPETETEREYLDAFSADF